MNDLEPGQQVEITHDWSAIGWPIGTKAVIVKKDSKFQDYTLEKSDKDRNVFARDYFKVITAEKIEEKPIVRLCNCSIEVIMNLGCKCGGQ